ncbi:Tautomerase/MIF [Serendipita vermifera]|nr:Tautomerase/MIF [Serendipita vermifera]
MPFVEVISNVKLEEEKEMEFLKSLSKVAGKITGRLEDYVLASYTYRKTLMFGGTFEPCFQAQIMSGGLTEDLCPSTSAALAAEIKEKLGIESSRGYIHLVDPPAHTIGFCGTTYGEILKKSAQSAQ